MFKDCLRCGVCRRFLAQRQGKGWQEPNNFKNDLKMFRLLKHPIKEKTFLLFSEKFEAEIRSGLRVDL
jgi:hypothetical protein